MDSREPVSDDAAWQLAIAYIGAWNARDREAWLDLLHPELEFRPTALVGTRIVFHGIDGAADYFDQLIASNRAEQAAIVGLRRCAPDRFLIELELLVDGRSVANAHVIAEVREGRFIDTRGYLSDVQTLASTGLIPHGAATIRQPGPRSV